MKIIFLNVQTSNEKWVEQAQQVYLEKVSHFHKAEVKNLKALKIAREKSDQKKENDSQMILNEITKDDFVVLFDEKGKSLSSVSYSQQLQKALNSGKKRLLFIIGGSFGVTEPVFKKAHIVITLSPMTLNHAFAQLVALEQTYRAFTILNHLPYHNS